MSNDAAVKALNESSRQRSEATRKRITRAINTLKKARQPININAVAREAGVARATIYNHADLHQRIKREKATAPALRGVSEPQRGHTPASGIVEALRTEMRAREDRYKQQISDLRSQLKTKESAIAALYGELARLKSCTVETPGNSSSFH